MKLGIITYHRAHNYGAVLQAYALKHLLESARYEVDILDYWPNYRKGMYDIIDLRFLDSSRSVFFKSITGLKVFLKLGVTYSLKKKRYDRFESFIHKELLNEGGKKVRDGKGLPEDYDFYIYGSDQIWRHNNLINFSGYDGVYWGQYPRVPPSRKVAYAASMGVINDTPQSRKFLLDNIGNFSNLSVREQSLGEWVKSVSGQAPEQVLDPAFLLSKEKWEDVSDSKGIYPDKYILFYNLNSSAEAVRLVDEMSSKYGCEVIELGGVVEPFRFSRRYRHAAGPKEFLALFKNATHVVSTSFHGVVFSLIFQKQFLALGMGKNAARVTDLLSVLGISERYLHFDRKSLPSGDIDYAVVNPVMEKLRQKSIGFLMTAIDGSARFSSSS